MTIKFEIPGVAVPKQSFRMVKDGKISGYQDRRVIVWEQCIGTYANQVSPPQPWEAGIGIRLLFWLPDRKRRDLDNLSKAVLDALKGIFYRDDTQVVDLHILKAINPLNPRVEIEIWEVEQP